MDLEEKVKNLTTAPGVYLMRDSLGNVIYIGKAKNLKNRVKTYFQGSKDSSPKVEKLVKNLKDFDYIITDTEFEAFILECKLIKELKPMYNRLMKTPLSYIYIVIKNDEVYPSIEISNVLIENDQNIYFGPYQNKNTVERALQGIKECFKILCSKSTKKDSSCLNHSLGLCVGMCINDSAVEYYNNIVKKIISFLNGDDSSILEDLKYKMQEAAEMLDFETAARYRDYIKSTSSLINRAKTIRFAESCNNILIIEPLTKDVIKIFLVKGIKILFSKKYTLDSIDLEQLKKALKRHIMVFFGNSFVASSHDYVSKEEIDEAQIIFSYLKSRPDCYVLIPQDWLHYNTSFHIDEAIDRLLHQ